jgi:hypothetical protein
VVGAQAAQHAQRLGVAFAPAQLAESPVRLGGRVDQQEPDGSALVVEPVQQPGEPGPDVGVGHPLGGQDAGEAEPGDGLADALERFELGPAQLEFGRGRDADGLDQVVDPALVGGQAAPLVDLEQCVLVPIVDPADRVTQLGRQPARKLPLDAFVQGHPGAFVPGQGRMGPKEQRPQLLIGRILSQQLFDPGDGLFDPWLAVAAELAVDDAAIQAVPVPLEIPVGVDQEIVVLLILELLGGIGMPHRMQLQQLPVNLAVVVVLVVDIGHFADPVLLDQALEGKGVDLRLAEPGRISRRAAHRILANSDPQPADVGGHGGRVHRVPAGAGQVTGDVLPGQRVPAAQDQQA